MTINDIDLQHIYEFMERGDPSNAPEHIVAYLNLLDTARGMLLRIDKFSNDEMVVKHFMIQGLSRYKAKQIVDEAKEYFYSDTVVSKKAWRNIYAEKADKVMNFAIMNMREVKDAVAIIKSIKEILDIRGVNEADKDTLPDELFQKQIVVYTTNAAELGLPQVDRNRLKEFIDKKIPELSEKQREMIYREADILPFKVFLDESENARKV